jgi:SulP family sulfate permease
MHGYSRAWLSRDVVAGLATGTVVIPQAMAYATIADLPVQVGLYTCLAPMVLYAALGGSRALSVSTTSTIAVLVATTLAGLSHRSDADLLSSAFTLTFLVGVCLLGMRLLHLGGLVESISPATLAGVRVGVGLTVAASQLPALLGVTADPDASGFFAKIADVLGKLGDADRVTVLVALVSLVVLLLQRRFLPHVPGALVVVAGGIALVAFTSVEHHGLALIDHVPTGLPTLSLPVPGDVFALLPGALAIAVMAFLETVLVARTNRERHEPVIDVDRELLANGVAALGGGLTQSLPPAGGFSQSAVNMRSGARSQAAGVVTAVLACLVALLLAPLLDDLPKAVLAAVVMMAIVALLDPSEFFRFARLDRTELWLALVVALLGLTGGMLLAVAVGVAVTLFLVIRAVNRPRVGPLFPRAGGGWTTEPALAAPAGLAEEVVAGALLMRLEGSVYTGNAQVTRDAVRDAVEGAREAERAQMVVLEGSAVHNVTIPLVETLRGISEDLATTGSTLLFAEFPPATLAVLHQSVWFAEQEEAGRVWPTVEEALAHVDTAG